MVAQEPSMTREEKLGKRRRQAVLETALARDVRSDRPARRARSCADGAEARAGVRPGGADRGAHPFQSRRGAARAEPLAPGVAGDAASRSRDALCQCGAGCVCGRAAAAVARADRDSGARPRVGGGPRSSGGRCLRVECCAQRARRASQQSEPGGLPPSRRDRGRPERATRARRASGWAARCARRAMPPGRQTARCSRNGCRCRRRRGGSTP